jgi:hypothetical protein
MLRGKATNKCVKYYDCKLVSDEYIKTLILARQQNEATIFDPPRCLVLHGLKNPGEADKEVLPFQHGMVKYEQVGDQFYTYHKTLASFKDFYSAFNEGNANLSGSFVIETFNTVNLKKEVYEIIQQKLIEICMSDCNQMLIQDLYIHILRRVKYFQEYVRPSLTAGPTRPQSNGKLINFFLSPNPISFRLSTMGKSTYNILKEAKKASKERKTTMLKKDTENYQKTVLEQMYEIEDPIESPIKEKRKREYLKPHARTSLLSFEVARDSGLKIRQSQFPK